MARKQWVALDVNVFDSDLGVDIRDRFGTVGLCMWVGFLAACKRNIVPGQIRYSSDAECLSLLGVPGVELVNEDLDAFTLDDFWTFLGQRKNTSRTTRKRLTTVRASHWDRWQKDAKKQTEAERKARSRAEEGDLPNSSRTPPEEPSKTSRTAPEQLSDTQITTVTQPPDSNTTDMEAERKARSRAKSERTEHGQVEDENRTDSDLDRDSDRDRDLDRDSSTPTLSALAAVGDRPTDRDSRTA